MADCSELIDDLDPSCAALNKAGGADKRAYITSKAQFTYTIDGNGYVNSITMLNNGSIPFKLKKFIGQPDKNSATWPLTAGDNVNTWNHTWIEPLYYSNPSELLAIEKAAKLKQAVVFFQGLDDKIMVLGLDKGMKATAGEGGTGILLNDSTAWTITLSGEQRTMPKYFSINGETATLDENLAYLDALSSI